MYYICYSSSTHANQSSSGARNSQAPNGPSDAHTGQSKDAVSNVKKITSEEKQGVILNAAARVQPIKPNKTHQNSSTMVSTSSAIGVYSSSTDPVHVPSPNSRSSGVVGAIKREVGVVGVAQRQSSDNKAKQSFVPSSSNSNSLTGKDGTSANSFQSIGVISKREQLSQTNVTEPSFPGIPVGRPTFNNQYNSRPHQQLAGHQRGISLKWLY